MYDKPDLSNERPVIWERRWGNFGGTHRLFKDVVRVLQRETKYSMIPGSKQPPGSL